MQTARLFLPPLTLAGCVFAAILRDTRGVSLSDADRFNHFPASPLVAVTYVLEGELCLLAADGTVSVLPPVSVSGPQGGPVTSWSPGPVLAVTVGLYPDAFACLTGSLPIDLANRTEAGVPAPLSAMSEAWQGPDRFWSAFCEGLAPHWAEARAGAANGAAPGWLGDWGRSIAARAALSGPGKSLRAAERRLRRWSGQTRQSLAFFAAIERLHRLAVTNPRVDLAGLAVEAGFSDQSHMGRALRRATGYSPARLNRMIDNEESFWCYRLLGERF